jgi:hypothetical protein
MRCERTCSAAAWTPKSVLSATGLLLRKIARGNTAKGVPIVLRTAERALRHHIGKAGGKALPVRRQSLPVAAVLAGGFPEQAPASRHLAHPLQRP